MKILHWMRKENSGLTRTTLEFAKYEENQGHVVAIKQPGENQPVYGLDRDHDVECIHSQIRVESLFNARPKFMWMHGEPLSSVGNGISMKAICQLAPKMDAFICMRHEEYAIWQSIKPRTFLVPKGIDLEVYRPIGLTEKLSGEPSVLYYENWRGNRNPLYLCIAMQQVWQKYPQARLHLYNVQAGPMHETFKALNEICKWSPFLRSLQGPVNDANALLNKVDIVVSCLHPLYARSIEALGAGKAFISPGYNEPGYPWRCDLQPESMASAIMDCWENYDKINYRKWAEDRHDVAETVRQSVEIYERYL